MGDQQPDSSTSNNPNPTTGKPYDRAVAAGWVRLVHSAGTMWFDGPGDDARLAVWDCAFAWDILGLTPLPDRWLSAGPQHRQHCPTEDAALAAALNAAGVA